MKNVNYGNRKTIYCIWGIMVLWTLGAHAAALPPNPDNAALLYYQAFLLRPVPDVTVEELVYNTRQEKLYELLRGGKLKPDPEVEIPKIEKSIHELEQKIKNLSSGPNEKMSPRERALYESDNYREQLFSQLESLKKSRKHYEKMRGVDPNKKIRNYLRKCCQTIGVAQTASEISKCNWGYLYLQGFGSFANQLRIETKNLGAILRTDALLLAADRDYRIAFERCLMMRRFARHLGNETTFGCSEAVDGNALKGIQLILGYMKPEADTLTWLKNQLAAGPLVSKSLSLLLKQDFERYIWAICKEAKIFPWLRQELAEKAPNDRLKKEALTLTNKELLKLIREPYAEFIDSIRDALASDMTYKQTYTRIESLGKEVIEEAEDNPAIILSLERDAETMPRRYSIHVAHISHLNAVKAAIEIYLLKATTGRLPEALPNGLPKDPYNGKNFEYKITDEGFVLRCRVKPVNERKVRQYEFKVKK